MTQKQKWQEVEEVIKKIGSEWECNFVDSIKARAMKEQLSQKQLEVLDNLFRRACASPY